MKEVKNIHIDDILNKTLNMMEDSDEDLFATLTAVKVSLMLRGWDNIDELDEQSIEPANTMFKRLKKLAETEGGADRES